MEDAASSVKDAWDESYEDVSNWVEDHTEDDGRRTKRWIDDHGADVVTAGAVGACIALSFGTCAVASVAAWGARSTNTLEDNGWSWNRSRNSIVTDGLITFLTLGVGGTMDEGLRLFSRPTMVNGVQVLSASPWMTRAAGGITAAWDVTALIGELATREC